MTHTLKNTNIKITVLTFIGIISKGIAFGLIFKKSVMNILKSSLLFISLFFLSQTHAKNLYVDPAGDDSISYVINDSNNPWATIGRAAWGSSDRNNQNPSEAAQAGDIVIVRAGIYVTSQMSGNRVDPAWNPANSGTAGNPIVFRAEGRVELESTSDAAGGPIIGTLERSYITWDGFYIDEDNVVTRPDTGPVVVWDSHYIIIENLEVNGNTAQWLDNHNSIRLEAAHNTIVRGNRFYGNRTVTSGNPNSNAASIMTYHSDHIIIEANEITDSDSGIYIKGVNEGPFDVRSNIVHNVSLYGLEFAQIDGLDTSDGRVRVYRNVFRDNGNSGIFINPTDGAPPSPVINSVDIVNNTIEGNPYGIQIRGSADNLADITFKNNIIVNASNTAIYAAETTGIPAFSIDYNLYFNNSHFTEIGPSSYTFLQFQGLGHDPHSLNEDPLFVDEAADNFELQTGSPAIDAAIDILDLQGNGVSAAINIGADMNAGVGLPDDIIFVNGFE